MPLRSLALVFLIAAFCLVAAASAPVAFAHAQLLRSAPAADEQLSTSPEAIQLWFSETVSPAGEAIRLLDAAGDQLELGEVAHGDDATSISADIPAPLPDGTYVVVWSV